MGAIRYRSLAIAGLSTLVLATACVAKRPDAFAFDLPSQKLGTSLRAVAALAHLNVAAPSDLVDSRQAPALSGDFTASEAIARLLKGSGLHAEPAGGGIIVRADSSAGAPGAGQPAGSDGEVLITGSRIRGAPIASSIISISRDEARKTGQTTVAEIVHSLPQSFGGGQNPGIGNNVPAGNGVDVGGASSINLRGLGSDATLTLINGHRVSYSASRQAVDISTIPLEAVDHIEVVPDGASALYGSDAVAGVANIILRHDFTGFETGFDVGGSTDGGNFAQRYGTLAGTKWRSGGVFASYEFARTTQITGSERSYTADRPSLSLMPSFRTNNALVSGHQRLADAVTLSVDGFFGDRISSSAYALNAAGDITTSGTSYHFHDRSFALAPTLTAALGGSWSGYISGSYGQDHTRYDIISYSAGKPTPALDNCYCNNAKSGEAGADGALLDLPGGRVKLALGGGYRSNRLVRYNGAGSALNIDRTQSSYFGYGELSIPIVGPAESLRWASRLSVSAALRYEDYVGIGDIVTPKIGLIYAPLEGVTFKGSWGRSFRAPTLYQQYAARNVVEVKPSVFGGTGYPAAATAIIVQGGNPALKPERARTWSATVQLDPHAVHGFHAELSYFSVDYRDRIVTPIAFLSQALSNPLYHGQVTADPTSAFLAQLIAGASVFTNASGAPHSPANVAVFIDDTNLNAGRQTIHGVDALIRYNATLGAADLGLRADSTYLTGNQTLLPGQATTPLAGVIFTPAHFRIRGGIDAAFGDFSLDATLNHTGPVTDTRKNPIQGEAMTTLDLATRYVVTRSRRWPRSLDLVLSAQNLFNAKPPLVAVSSFFDAPYDSTNYSAVGRYVSLSVRTRW